MRIWEERLANACKYRIGKSKDVTYQDRTIDDTQALDMFDLQIRIHDTPARAFGRHHRSRDRVEEGSGVLSHVVFNGFVRRGIRKIAVRPDDIVMPSRRVNEPLNDLDRLSQGEYVPFSGKEVGINQWFPERIGIREF